MFSSRIPDRRIPGKTNFFSRGLTQGERTCIKRAVRGAGGIPPYELAVRLEDEISFWTEQAD